MANAPSSQPAAHTPAATALDPTASAPPLNSPLAPPPQLQSSPPPEFIPPLGDTAARGFFYALVQFGGTKVLTLLGQYAISWILGGEDFGYIGLAFTVAAFCGLIAGGQMRDLLVQRWREYERWATPAHWMSVTLGGLGTLLMITAAPLAAWFFRDARLTPLIIVLAFQNLFTGVAVVPEARLAIDLRFKLLAWVNFAYAALVMALSVLFALLGFGPYSFILPWPIGALFRALVLWMAARPRLHFRPHLELWKYLAGDNVLLLAATFFLVITAQADYVILGRMYPDKEVIGQYFWAFNLSTQALQLLALNLGSVLLPSLAKLQDDPQRQLGAFVRAAKGLTLLTMPACLLQATLADPVIRIAFRSEWYPAIPIVAVLSVGWMLMAVHSPSLNTLKAQGRFAALTWFLAVSAVAFVTAIWIGARAGAAIGTAAGSAVYSSIFGPLSAYIAMRPLGGTLRQTAQIFLPPLLASILAFGPPCLLAWLIPPIPPAPLQHLLRVALVLTVGSALYIAIIRHLSRAAALDIWARVQDALRRSRPSSGAKQGA